MEVVDEIWIDSIIRKSESTHSSQNYHQHNVLDEFGTVEFEHTIARREVLPSYTFENGWTKDLYPRNKDTQHISPAAQLALEQLATKNKGHWGPFNETRVNEVHQQGFTGKNIVIGFLDTGVDTTHSALKGKYLGGYDFVGDNYNGYNSPIPDNNPNDDVGHGTEAVGIALGRSSIYMGVAPDAKFRMYRVFNSDMATTTDIILSALERAVADKVDIISISAAEASSWAFSPFSIAVSKIAKLGTIVVFAAGNGGRMGPYYASAGSSTEALSVGNVLSTKLVSWLAYIACGNSREPKTVNYVSASANILPLDGVYDVDYFPQSLCSYNGFPTKNNNIILTPLSKDPDCSKRKQYQIASHQGYKYVIFVDKDPVNYFYEKQYISRSSLIGAATISNFDVNWLRNQHSKGASFQMVFNSSVHPEEVVTYAAGTGRMSPTSSWGPTYDGFLSPDVSAPGGDVFSIARNNSYTAVSGTSFACPYVAGIAALYLEKHGYSKTENKPSNSNVNKEFKNRLISYSNSVKWNSGYDKDSSEIAPHIQQGGGLVDAFATVVEGQTIVDPPYLVVNSSHHPFRFNYFEIRVENRYDKLVNYKMEFQPALGVNCFDDDNKVQQFPPEVLKGTERVIFYAKEFTLFPGSSTKIKLGILLDLKPVFQNALYTGKITFRASLGPDASVVYSAAANDVHTSVSIFNNPVIFGTRSENNGFIYSNSSSLVFDLANSQYPMVYYELNYGTIEYSMDLVSENFSISDLTIQNIYHENENTQRPKSILSRIFGKKATVPTSDTPTYYGMLSTSEFTFPQAFFPRAHGVEKIFQLSTGEILSAGRYRILQRALKPYGNRYKIGDWQVNLSEVFTIL